MFSAFSVIEFQIEDRFTYREVERKTTVKRITSDSDPSQYVDVEASIASCSRTRSIRTTSASTNQKRKLERMSPARLDPTQRIVDFSFGNRIALIYGYGGRPNAIHSTAARADADRASIAHPHQWRGRPSRHRTRSPRCPDRKRCSV